MIRFLLILATIAFVVWLMAIAAPRTVGYDSTIAALAHSERTITVNVPSCRPGRAEYGYGQIRFGGRGPEAWRWQLVLERRRAADLQERLTRRVLEVRGLRRTLNQRLRIPTGHWLDGAFLCLHRHERDPRQGWQTNTGNGYDGGLQMDADFERTYAPPWVIDVFGPDAHRWPAAIQITVGIRAWTVRGFSPWPNTRKPCGL